MVCTEAGTDEIDIEVLGPWPTSNVGVDVLTVGRYLLPTADHAS